MGRVRIFRCAVALSLAATTAWLAVSAVVVWRLTRRPTRPVPIAATIAGETPRDVRLETSDGETLAAWFHRGTTREPAVVLLHGNGGTRASTLPVAMILARRNCSVLCVTLRAHGESTGDVNDLGRSARHDVVAAVEFLEQECPRSPVVVRGSSLGAAAAIHAMRGLGNRVSGYVLECPYRDLETAVAHRTRMHLPAALAFVADRGVALTAPFVVPGIDAVSPLTAIADAPAGMPVLILAGGRDRHATPTEARDLASAASAADVTVVVFPEGGHESLLPSDSALYERELADLLDRAARRAR